MKKDTSFRNLLMLRMIPREPNSITAEILKERLADQGYDIHLRTIQRDLNKYSTRFGLLNWKSEDTKTNCWCWSKNDSLWDIPEMNAMTALTFNLVEKFLSRMIPQSIFQYMNPHFNRSRHLLRKLGKSKYSGWPEKLQIIPRGLSLEPPFIDQTIYEDVFEAVINEKKTSILYRKREAENTTEYLLNPLGLVFNQEMIYLVATKEESEKIQHFALHRMEKVNTTRHESNIPEMFDLKDYVEMGAFDYKINSDPIHLKVLFGPEIAAHLYEAQLSNDQNLVPQKNGKVLVEATIRNSSALRWWLLGFGDGVEVLEPIELRQDFKKTISQLFKIYST